jgi:hypothetical protein
MSPPKTTHIVLFKYAPTIPWLTLESHFAAFAALPSTCLLPNGNPYILSLKLGKNTSWEPLAKSMTHAFILEFASRDDRDYYLLHDPVHHTFSESARGLIEDSVVVDLEDGVLFDTKAAGGGEGASSALHKGRCHCGKVAFEVTLPDPRHILCHCRTCQLLGGGAYSLNAIVPLETVRITRGKCDVYAYTGESGKEVRCYYCGRCTSHVYHVQEVMPGKAVVRTGLLDSSAKMGVGGEIFAEGALGWVRDLKGALGV